MPDSPPGAMPGPAADPPASTGDSEPGDAGRRGMGSLRDAGGELHRSRLIISTTGLMVASWTVTTTLGFAFWFVASRAYEPQALGLASAAIAAATLIARLTVSGVGTALAGFLPTFAGRRMQLITMALLVTMAIGGVLGLAFIAVIPAFSQEYQPLVADLPLVLLFVGAAAMTAAGVVADQVMVSLRYGGLQLFRNLVFAGGKLVFLVIAAITIGASHALVLVGVWALGDVASFVAIAAVRRRLPEVPGRQELRIVVGLTRNAAGHHLMSAMRSGPALLMPVLVTGLVSATANAAFYVALIMTTAVQVVASSATFTLYAVGDRSPAAFQRQLRVTLGLSSLIVIAGIVALLILGPWLLGLFGEAYATQAADSLPWLALCAIPLVIIDHWIALRRVRLRLRGAVATLAVAAALQVALSVVGVLNAGLTGLAAGWFAALCLVGLFMLGEVVAGVTTAHPERDLARVEPVALAPEPARLAVVEARATPAEIAAEPMPEIPISVFIPVRNDGAWLPRAIESVLAQRYPYWELVIGDNASTEDIRSIVERYADPRIRYHRFDRGVSILESWNRTARLCRHPWVHSLSADDAITPDCLELLAKSIAWYAPRVPRLVMAVASCRRIYPDGTSADHVWYGSKPVFPVEDRAYDPHRWLELCTEDGNPPWQVGSMTISADALDESGGLFRTEIGLSADFEMAVRVGAYGYVAYLTTPLLDYTVRDDSDGPQRLIDNRARGIGDTVVGLALQNVLHVHDEARGLSAGERRRLLDAISRTHLQRAAQHRVLPQGKGRAGAIRDVLRAFRWSPGVVLRPSGLVYAAGAILAPQVLLESAKNRIAARLHGPAGSPVAPPIPREVLAAAGSTPRAGAPGTPAAGAPGAGAPER